MRASVPKENIASKDSHWKTLSVLRTQHLVHVVVDAIVLGIGDGKQCQATARDRGEHVPR